MIETFTATVPVAGRDQDYAFELARQARAWFGTEVECLALDVGLDRAEGTPYLARGTYAPRRRPATRAESVATWLGLVRRPAR